MFLEISQNSQENNHAGVSFLIKLQALACSFIKKETLSQVFSCEFCEIYKNTFFTGHLWTTASEFVTKMLIFRSSRSQMFFKIGVLKNFSISEPLPNKVAGLFYRTHTLVASEFLRQPILFWQLNMLFIADSHTGFCSGLFWKHELNLKSSLWSCFVKMVFLENL